MRPAKHLDWGHDDGSRDGCGQGMQPLATTGLGKLCYRVPSCDSGEPRAEVDVLLERCGCVDTGLIQRNEQARSGEHGDESRLRLVTAPEGRYGNAERAHRDN